MSLLLPWFPIILGVGVGGRLLGRSRGFGLGILCALFWIVLVQAATGSRVWQEPWLIAAVIAGAVAIVAMGCWSGEASMGDRSPAQSGTTGVGGGSPPKPPDGEGLVQLSAMMDRFDDWLEGHRDVGNPWPRFDEFIRSSLYQVCQATHVRPYRLPFEGEELISLSETDAFSGPKRVSARRGIVGHVVTSGRSHFAADPAQGELINELSVDSKEPIEWCFAITQGTRRLGAVVVGRLALAPQQHKPLLRAVDRLTTHFWCRLQETIRCREAVSDDPISGLHAREAFLAAAEVALGESYRQCEPVAIAVIDVEGIRELNDSCRWEVADELIREVGGSIRRKIRMDDRSGRFDGSRFVILLRRVDSDLASLIVGQIMSRLTAMCSDQSRWRTSITVRCGLAGSGTETPDLRALVSRALAEERRARIEKRSVASDLDQAHQSTELIT